MTYTAVEHDERTSCVNSHDTELNEVQMKKNYENSDQICENKPSFTK